MSFKLSDFYVAPFLRQDNQFSYLGMTNSDFSETLVYADKIAYLRQALKNNHVSAIITSLTLGENVDAGNKGLICVEKPRESFYNVYKNLNKAHMLQFAVEAGVGHSCEISKSAAIGQNVKIGNNVTIAANVTIHDNVIIGDGCFIDSGAQVGVDGLLYYFDESGNTQFVKHSGSVIIGNNVTLLSNSVIAKSVHAQTPTRVMDHSIIGIATTVGHDAQIEPNVIVSGNCVIARGAKISRNVWIGSNALISQYVNLSEAAQVMAGSIVVKDVAASMKVSGNFAYDHSKRLKEFMALNTIKHVGE